MDNRAATIALAALFALALGCEPIGDPAAEPDLAAELEAGECPALRTCLDDALLQRAVCGESAETVADDRLCVLRLEIRVRLCLHPECQGVAPCPEAGV